MTFDGEKSLPYLFDTIVRLYRDEKGRFLGECLKDRSNTLPLGGFEVSYARFEELFGKQALTRRARPTAFATDEQKQQIREHIARFEMTPEQVTRRLAAYGTDSLDTLSEDNARVILTKFESALTNRDDGNPSEKET